MLRAFLKSFLKAFLGRRKGTEDRNNRRTKTVRPSSILFGTSSDPEQQAMFDAILELRRIVEAGVAEHITAGIAAFKAKAEDRLDARELADEVADAEAMFAALGYADRLQRGEPLAAMATTSGGSCYYRRKNVALEGPRHRDDYGQLDICSRESSTKEASGSRSHGAKCSRSLCRVAHS